MNLKNIDHIGIAVTSIQESLSFWEASLGIELHGIEEVAEQKVKTAFLPIDDTEIELLEPTSADSSIAKFIEKRGEGLHHVAIRVDDIESALAELKARGVQLIDEVPRNGAGGARIAFVHPRATHGVLLAVREKENTQGISDSKRPGFPGALAVMSYCRSDRPRIRVERSRSGCTRDDASHLIVITPQLLMHRYDCSSAKNHRRQDEQ